MTTRRDFFTGLATGAAALAMDSRRSAAQQKGVVHDSVMVMDSTNLFAMDQGAAQSVRLPAKPGAKPSMTDAERDELEHHIHCQCGCTLDVYTCRTTDFSCQVSPAMHKDVLALVEGGYGAQEILDAFTKTYGEKVLMSPTKSGFNLVAWLTPGLALIVAGAAVTVLVRRWGAHGPAQPSAAGGAYGSGVGATSDELARLEAAVKAEDEQ
ncbi:MAG TPA: cytochrome c-type biogenesis protein CcmH [Gemmatimonadaceae bacterium]|jgi:cytochrome c-type biogenesis protein CcmH